MFGKYILYIIGIVSFIWIGYVGYDIIDKENQFQPTNIFGEFDSEILVINKLEHNPFSKITFKTTKQNQIIIDKIIPWLDHEDKVIISKNQNQIFIEHNENWTKETITKLFKNAKLRLSFNQFKQFKSGIYNGKYAQTILLLYSDDSKKPTIKMNWDYYDKKANATIIKFSKNKCSISDIYIKSNDKIEYISSNSSIKSGRLVEDQQLFSIAIPNTINKYHFYEKTYYQSIDKIFSKSPLSSWIENGFVEFELDNEKVIISDYLSGQEPILVLNDLINSENQDVDESEAEFENIQLTKNFPEKINSKFYIKLMDDFVVISSSKNICDKVIADYRLGNTLALKKDRLAYFYDNLPQKVSERSINSGEKFSKSKYKDKLFETHLFIQNKLENKSLENLSLSIQIGMDIQDIKVLKGIGNMIILTKNGKIIGVKNGKKLWSKEVNGYPFGEISNYNLEQDLYYVTTSKEVHLFNQNGEEQSGFPIKFKENAVNEVTFFENKNTTLFAVANEQSIVSIYNLKSKLVYSLKSGLTSINKPVDIWKSKNNLFMGAKDEFNFVMFNLDKKKEHRRFSIPKNTYSISNENELMQFSFQENNLVKIDQKGIVTIIKSIQGGKLIGISKELENKMLTIQTENEILFLNEKGEEICQQVLEFGQLDNVNISKFEGELYISVIDGIGNNVYLFRDGEQLNKKAFDGKSIVKTTFYNSETLITTIVDEFIIQYRMN